MSSKITTPIRLQFHVKIVYLDLICETFAEKYSLITENLSFRIHILFSLDRRSGLNRKKIQIILYFQS